MEVTVFFPFSYKIIRKAFEGLTSAGVGGPPSVGQSTMSRPKSFLALIGAVAALGSDTPFSVDNNSKRVRMRQPLCSSHERTHDQHHRLKIHAALLAFSASLRSDNAPR
jgi:hypothetical protein